MSELTYLKKEIKEIKTRVSKVENIIEKRLVGQDEPSKDEIASIRRYDRLKRSGRAKYVPLGKALKSIGIRAKRNSRKTRS